jgi:hypothetical protein
MPKSKSKLLPHLDAFTDHKSHHCHQAKVCNQFHQHQKEYNPQVNKEDRIRSHCHCTSELVPPVIAIGEPNPYIPGPKTLQSIMLQVFISFLAHLNLKAKQNLLTIDKIC